MAHGVDKIYPTHILASRWERPRIPVATAIFPCFDNGHTSGTNRNTANKLVQAIYRLADEIERQFQRQPLYLRYPVSKGNKCNNLNQTVCGECNMAATKLEKRVYQLPDEIETKFQYFRSPAFLMRLMQTLSGQTSFPEKTIWRYLFIGHHHGFSESGLIRMCFY